MPRSVGIFVAQQNRETLGSFTDSPMFLWLSLGAILGALFIRFAGSRSPDGKLRFFAVGLVVAAVIYVGFALADGVEWIALEAAGVVLFVLLAYAGVRHSPLLLALGWTVHVGWDVGLHLARQQVVVPAWYPSACISFDLLVAGYVVWTVWATQQQQEAA